MKLPFSITWAVPVLLVLVTMGCSDEKFRTEVGGVTLRITETLDTEIDNAGSKIPVIDFKVELSNSGHDDRWVRYVSKKYVTPYLKERNPEDISYRVYRDGKKPATISDQEGYFVMSGASVEHWRLLQPDEKLTFIIPVPKPSPTEIQFAVDIATDHSKSSFERLVSELYEL